MRSEAYLKDFVRASVEDQLRSERPAVINQEKFDEVNDFFRTHPGSSVQSVAEASSML